MISRFHVVNRAASILMVGVALFFLACQMKTVVKEPAVAEPGLALLAEAEEAFQAGAYDKATTIYEGYLETYPEGKSTGVALYGIARIHINEIRFDQALILLKKIVADYPDLTQMPEVRYYLAMALYRLGDYRDCEKQALAWLADYPENPLEGEIFLLLGNLSMADQDRPGAFSWWLKAEEALLGDPVRQAEFGDRLTGFIQESGLEDLEKMVDHAAGGNYAPPVYHKLATTYLEGNDLEQAKAMAMALIRSTPEQHWVDRGREIFERIEAELSVKPGVIGCLLPLSGPFAIYGQEVLNGIQMGMGLFGESERKETLELLIKDTGGTQEGAISAVQELVQEGKAIAVIGPLASKPSLAAARKAQEMGIPIITLTQLDGITAEGDMVFRNFLTPAKEVERLLDKSINEMSLRRFGIFYPDNSYGRFLMNLFWNKVEEMGGFIMAVEAYSPKETDFAVQIKKMVGLHYPRPDSVVRMFSDLRASEAEESIEHNAPFEEEPEPIVDFEAVFIPDNDQQVALIAPQFPFHNVFGVRFLGTSLWQSPELIEHAGDYIQGAIFPSGFFLETESDKIKAFLEDYKENFDAEAGILAATGYDTIKFLQDLFEKGDIRTRKELRSKMLGDNSFHGLTGNIAFDERGEVVKKPLLLSVSGRRLINLP